MERAGVHPGELDAIVLSTATPDRLLPSTAVDLQAELGATRAAAFDIGAACSGWLYAMTVAEGMIASGVAETMLVVGAEKMSAIVDWKDRATCVLFGDGAGAAILQARRRTGKGILSDVHAQRRHSSPICSIGPRAARRIRSAQQVLDERTHFVRMAGREVFKHAVRSMSEAADRALDGAQAHRRRHRPADSASGQRPHHRGDGEARRHPDGQGLRERRPVRQHVVGIDSDRDRRSDRARSDSRRARPCCSSRSAPDSPGPR